MFSCKKLKSDSLNILNKNIAINIFPSLYEGLVAVLPALLDLNELIVCKKLWLSLPFFSKISLYFQVLSYGGYLRFAVETEGGNTLLPPGVLSSYPLIQIQGNGKIVLEHFPALPNPSNRYEVR